MGMERFPRPSPPRRGGSASILLQLHGLRRVKQRSLLFRCAMRELPDELRFADIVILPGSKQTVDDLIWLRARGLADACLAHARQGLVVGICGGMQMLGKTISDPSGVEHQGSDERPRPLTHSHDHAP